MLFLEGCVSGIDFERKEKRGGKWLIFQTTAAHIVVANTLAVPDHHWQRRSVGLGHRAEFETAEKRSNCKNGENLRIGTRWQNY